MTCFVMSARGRPKCVRGEPDHEHAVRVLAWLDSLLMPSVELPPVVHHCTRPEQRQERSGPESVEVVADAVERCVAYVLEGCHRYLAVDDPAGYFLRGRDSGFCCWDVQWSSISASITNRHGLK